MPLPHLLGVGCAMVWVLKGTEVPVNCAGLFNPQSFLTAVMQTTARKNDWPLDKMVIVTEVTKKTPEQVSVPRQIL